MRVHILVDTESEGEYHPVGVWCIITIKLRCTGLFMLILDD